MILNEEALNKYYHNFYEHCHLCCCSLGLDFYYEKNFGNRFRIYNLDFEFCAYLYIYINSNEPYKISCGTAIDDDYFYKVYKKYRNNLDIVSKNFQFYYYSGNIHYHYKRNVPGISHEEHKLLEDDRLSKYYLYGITMYTPDPVNEDYEYGVKATCYNFYLDNIFHYYSYLKSKLDYVRLTNK